MTDLNELVDITWATHKKYIDRLIVTPIVFAAVMKIANTLSEATPEQINQLMDSLSLKLINDDGHLEDVVNDAIQPVREATLSACNKLRSDKQFYEWLSQAHFYMGMGISIYWKKSNSFSMMNQNEKSA